jgi:hypothetical protein
MRRAAVQDAVPVGGLLDLDPAGRIEAVRERAREAFRHVLHDQQPGASAGIASRIVRSASVPPVDAPERDHLVRGRGRARRGAGAARLAVPRGRNGPGAGRRTRALGRGA